MAIKGGICRIIRAISSEISNKLEGKHEMSKKHIRIGCALLALVLVLTAGIVVLNTEAAEVTS